MTSLKNSKIMFWNTSYSQFFHSRLWDCKKQVFLNAEQFMSYHKALFFKDFVMAEKIKNSINHLMIKEYDKMIKNYNKDSWNLYREDVISLGNYYKFRDNIFIRDMLLNDNHDLLATDYNIFSWYEGDTEMVKDKNFWSKVFLMCRCLYKVRQILITNDTKIVSELEKKIYKECI